MGEASARRLHHCDSSSGTVSWFSAHNHTCPYLFFFFFFFFHPVLLISASLLPSFPLTFSPFFPSFLPSFFPSLLVYCPSSLSIFLSFPVSFIFCSCTVLPSSLRLSHIFPSFLPSFLLSFPAYLLFFSSRFFSTPSFNFFFPVFPYFDSLLSFFLLFYLPSLLSDSLISSPLLSPPSLHFPPSLPP